MMKDPFARRSIQFESLQRRRLLAVDAHISHTGTLLVAGTAGDDSINVTLSETAVIVEHNGDSSSFDRADVRRVAVDAAAGEDVVTITGALRSTLTGGDGDDDLLGGSSNDSLNGGSGSDTLRGSLGNDTLNRGPEQDEDNDVADYHTSNRGLSFNIGGSERTTPRRSTVDAKDKQDLLIGAFDIGGSALPDRFFIDAGGFTIPTTSMGVEETMISVHSAASWTGCGLAGEAMTDFLRMKIPVST